MRYLREEQETIYNYDVIEGQWHIYSSYPPHIRQLKERADISNEEKDGQGRTISVTGVVNKNQVRLFKPL